MDSSPLLAIWPLLAGLAGLLVTCVLLVLSAQRKNAVEIHERVRQSKQMRRAYLEAIRTRRPPLH